MSRAYKIDKGWLGYYLVLFRNGTDVACAYDTLGPYDRAGLRNAIGNLGWSQSIEEINKAMNARLGGGWSRVS